MPLLFYDSILENLWCLGTIRPVLISHLSLVRLPKHLNCFISIIVSRYVWYPSFFSESHRSCYGYFLDWPEAWEVWGIYRCSPSVTLFDNNQSYCFCIEYPQTLIASETQFLALLICIIWDCLVSWLEYYRTCVVNISHQILAGNSQEPCDATRN